MKDRAGDEGKIGLLKTTKMGSECRQDGQQMTQRGEEKRGGYFYHVIDVKASKRVSNIEGKDKTGDYDKKNICLHER